MTQALPNNCVLPRMQLVMLSDEDSLIESLSNKDNKAILFVKPVQSGKTNGALKGITYLHDSEKSNKSITKGSIFIMVGDNNVALNNQTQGRTVAYGWKTMSYTDFPSNMALRERMKIASNNKEQIVFCFLMQTDNLETLQTLFVSKFGESYNFVMVVDEGDKNRSSDATKGGEVDFDTEEEEEAAIPPVTRMLLEFKNFIIRKDSSRIIYVTATPMGILSSECSDWLVVYQSPFKNWVGIGLNHTNPNLIVRNCITECSLKVSELFSGSYEDKMYNTLRGGILIAAQDFIELGTKDPSFKQVMLVSVANRKRTQTHIKEELDIFFSGKGIDVIVMNSDTKGKDDSLQSMITSCKSNKVVVIAGFMASRGVSFTERSRKYDLVSQVHYTKKLTPMNSRLQAMRIFGPERVTVSRPTLYCSYYGEQDIRVNFAEYYRIFSEVSNGNFRPEMGRYNWLCPMAQAGHHRWLKQGRNMHRPALFPSVLPSDWEPLMFEEEED